MLAGMDGGHLEAVVMREPFEGQCLVNVLLHDVLEDLLLLERAALLHACEPHPGRPVVRIVGDVQLVETDALLLSEAELLGRLLGLLGLVLAEDDQFSVLDRLRLELSLAHDVFDPLRAPHILHHQELLLL